MKIVLTADGSPTLFSEAYGQTYHSKHGALAESRHVFLEQSGAEDLLQKNRTATILEVGFGTGLNFFLTAATAVKYDATLRFISLDKELLPAEVIQSFAEYLPEEIAFAARQYSELREKLPENPDPRTYTFTLSDHIELTVILGNAEDISLDDYQVDIVYLDSFSPKENPELWTAGFFSKLRKALFSDGVLVTYSVSGAVRRALSESGFDVTRIPGPPGGKREMLRANVKAAG